MGVEVGAGERGGAVDEVGGRWIGGRGGGWMDEVKDE